MVVIFTLNDIDAAALAFLKTVSDHKLFAFHGEMGAGKTTFIHAVCMALQVKDVTGSPTFSIINEYETIDGQTVFHIDLYRLTGEKEAQTAGVEDCLYANNYCFVEWPEKAPALFPSHTIHCYLTTIAEDARKLQINL